MARFAHATPYFPVPNPNLSLSHLRTCPYRSPQSFHRQVTLSPHPCHSSVANPSSGSCIRYSGSRRFGGTLPRPLITAEISAVIAVLCFVSTLIPRYKRHVINDNWACLWCCHCFLSLDSCVGVTGLGIAGHSPSPSCSTPRLNVPTAILRSRSETDGLLTPATAPTK